MNKQEITPILEELIGQSKYKDALELMSIYAKDHDRFIENDILMQTASFNRNDRDFQNSLISKESYEIAMKKLGNALSFIIENLPEQGNKVNLNEKKGASKSKFGREQNGYGEVRKILFLTANPKNPDGPALRTESEMREVKDELSRTSDRDSFEMIYEPAIRIPTITRAMRAYKPQIVHFSGYGRHEGIVVEGPTGESILFPQEGLNRLFKISRDHVDCVLLNACYSKTQAQTISKHEIYVIGMSDKIGDITAKEFAVGFYQSLGEGDSIEIAYEVAMVNIAHKLKYKDLPELWYNGEKVSA